MAKRRKARFGGNNRPKWERFLRVGLANMSNIAGSLSHFGQKGHCCQRIGASSRSDCACLGVENSQHRGLERKAVRGVASCREMRGCAAAVFVATGLGVSTPFLLRVPKRFRAMVARAARGLAFRGMSRSCSRHAGPGSPGRGPQLLSPCRTWLSRVQAAISRAA